MHSVIQEKSYGSVKVLWLNKEALDKNLESAIEALVREKTEVGEVWAFGSYSENKITAYSDLDILLIVNQSKKRFIDRPEGFLDYFQNVGLGVDLFIYTPEELNAGIPWLNQILKQGRCLFRRR
jgi:predicted nucleotidyltransferase